MKIKSEIINAFNDHIKTAQLMESLYDSIEKAVEMVIATFEGNYKILLGGNGGSAADAQHWAAEWVIRLTHSLERPCMPAIALSTDTSILTAGANDIGYDNVFARQVEGLGNRGDLFIAISTSGNSENLIRATEMAHSNGMKVLGILGNDGGNLATVCDHSVIVPSTSTQRIQEMHVIVGHLMCELSERALYEK
jgi:D-sedoheptulose 7-phosphate isomerase